MLLSPYGTTAFIDTIRIVLYHNFAQSVQYFRQKLYVRVGVHLKAGDMNGGGDFPCRTGRFSQESGLYCREKRRSGKGPTVRVRCRFSDTP